MRVQATRLGDKRVRQLVDQNGCEQQQRRDHAEDPVFELRPSTQLCRKLVDAQRPGQQREDDQPAVVDADFDAADGEQLD